jgi:hypothetical protein
MFKSLRRKKLRGPTRHLGQHDHRLDNSGGRGLPRGWVDELWMDSAQPTDLRHPMSDSSDIRGLAAPAPIASDARERS